MLGEKVEHNLLSNIFCFAFIFIQCKLIIRNIFLLTLLTLSKSERATNQGIYNQGIKVQLTYKDIKKGERAWCSKGIFEIQLSLSGVKGYLCYKTIFCNKVALDAYKIMFSMISRYLEICVFVKSTYFKVCVVIRHCFIIEVTLMHILFEF